MKRFTVLIAVVLAILTAVSYASATQYRIIDLGAGKATAINNIGQIVGYTSDERAFLWQNGSGMQDLGTIGGTMSEAYAINDNGQVVGMSRLPGNDYHWRAFLWQSGTGMQNLGTFGGESEARGINNYGQAVGASGLTDTDWRAFLWQSGSGMQDIGNLGGNWAQCTAINDSGCIAGYSYIAGNGAEHAFLWQNGVGMQDLGTLVGWNSDAWGINNSGQVVGSSNFTRYTEHAFVWQSGLGMQDLGTLGGTNSYARGINDSGWIVGSAYDSNGIEHAVLWQPVPEPSGILALVCGFAGLGGAAWRRRGKQIRG